MSIYFGTGNIYKSEFTHGGNNAMYLHYIVLFNKMKHEYL